MTLKLSTSREKKIKWLMHLKDKITAATSSDQYYLKIKETLQQGNF
jgi:hypothetical protein